MTPSILLVDDNRIQAATRRAILGHAGHRILLAGDAQRALELLADGSHRIGLVLTDHIMPGMNGPQFVKELRRSYPLMPVLVLSGLPDAEAEYDGLGVVFRHKPFHPEALVELCRGLLGQQMSRTA